MTDLVTSDEAVLSLNSEVNTGNVIRYAPYGNGHPPDHYVEDPEGAGQVMVWVGLTGIGNVSRPHFINGNLDTREYLRMARYNVIQRECGNLGTIQNNAWWQQDSASSRTNNQSINCLCERFPGKLISKRRDIN